MALTKSFRQSLDFYVKINDSKKSDLKALELAEDFKAMRALENDPTLFMLHPKIHTVPDS